jgi:transcriptional regulator with XRE-family HTH domain
MSKHHPPLSDAIPDILRDELSHTPPLTDAMRQELARANRELEADPAFQADFLKALFVNEMLTALEIRGESKAQLADRLGKSRQYVQKLFDEDKRVNFTVDTICEVAHALGRRVHLHVCEDGEEPMILTSRKSVSRDWPAAAKHRTATAWGEVAAFRPSNSVISTPSPYGSPAAA